MEHNGNVINVVDYNYDTGNLELNHSFLDKLKSANIKKLIIIIVNGQVGKGKSTFGSVLLNKLLYLKNDNKDEMLDTCVFETSDASKSFTMGMNAYIDFIPINDKLDEAILLIDSEGLNGIIDDRSKEEVDSKLTKLLTVSLLVSSVFVYLSPIRLEAPDADALTKVQTRAELLRDKTKIEYPNIYFIISRTNELKLEDATKKNSTNFSAKSSSQKGTKEIVIEPEQEKLLLDYLSKTTRLNEHIKKNFKANVFPQIDTNEIDIKNPKEILIKDKLMDNHMYNLICKFETHFKTKPGTSEFMSSKDLADYLTKVIEAVNTDKFDIIAVERANTLLDLKKKIEDGIKKDFITKFKIDPETIQTTNALKNATSGLEKDITEYWQNKKADIRRELSNKIKVEEEVNFTINEFKVLVNNFKNDTKKKLLNEVYETKSKQLENELKILRNDNKKQSATYEKMKKQMENDLEILKIDINKFKEKSDELNKQLKEKTTKLSETEKSIEITQSKIREIKEYEVLDEFNRLEWNELNEKMKKLTEKTEKLDDELKILNNKKIELENEIKIKNQQLEDKKNENEESMRRYNELSEKEKSLKMENAKTSMEIAKLEQKLDVMKSDIEEKKEKRKELEKDIKEKTEAIEKLENEKFEELERKARLDQAPELSGTAINSTDDIIKKNELINEKEQLTEKTAKLKKEVEDLQKNFAEYKLKYNEETKITLEEKKKRIEKNYDEIIKGEMDKVVRERQAEIYQLQMSIERLKSDIAEIDKDIDKKKELIRNKPDFLKSKLELSLEAYKQEELENENKKLEQELDIKRKEKAAQEKRHEELKEEVHQLETKIETSKKEFEQYQNELKKVEAQKNKEKTDLEAELQSVVDNVNRSLESFNEIKVAYEDVVRFISIIKEFIKNFQALFAKINSFDKDPKFPSEHLDNLISQFFEQFSSYKTDKKIFEVVKPFARKGMDITSELDNFFSSLNKLESHEYYIKGEVRKYSFLDNEDVIEFEHLMDNCDD